jgi:hypothetical protein
MATPERQFINGRLSADPRTLSFIAQVFDCLLAGTYGLGLAGFVTWILLEFSYRLEFWQ